MRRAGDLLALVLVLAATTLGILRLAPRPNGLLRAPGLVPTFAPTAANPAPRGERALAGPLAAPSPSPTPPATPMPTATPSPSPTATPSPTPTRTVVSRAIFVDQNAQVMHVYENGAEIRSLPCSTGLPGRVTPAWVGKVGRYVDTIFSFGVYADEAWYLFKASGDILIHGAPYTWVDGTKVYREVDALGRRPSSHGCIRLLPEDARWLTEWNPRGVPMAISPLTREIGP